MPAPRKSKKKKQGPVLPEGRHIAGPEAADKLDKNFDKYRRSEKGKEAYKRYQNSDKGKEVKRRYFQSDKGKEALRRWLDSDKGKTHMANKKLQRRVFATAKKLRDTKPDLTLAECLVEAEWHVATETLSQDDIG